MTHIIFSELAVFTFSGDIRAAVSNYLTMLHFSQQSYAVHHKQQTRHNAVSEAPLLLSSHMDLMTVTLIVDA